MRRFLAVFVIGFAFAFAGAQEAYSQQKKPPKKAQGATAGSSKQRASSTSSSGKNGKNARASSTSGSADTEAATSYEEAYAVPAAAYEATPAYTPPSTPEVAPAAYVTPTPAPTPAPTLVVAPAPAGPVAQIEVADVPSDKQWDEFRKCMAGQCENSRNIDGPPNEACYNEDRFTEAFKTCEYAVAANKRDAFKNYFWDTFLIKEMTSRCKSRDGEFNEDQRRCRIIIRYVRKEAKGKDLFGKDGTGCPNQNAPKAVFLGSKPLPCTYENFGLGECRAHNSAAQMQKDSAMLKGIMGTVTAVASSTFAVIGAAGESKAARLALQGDGMQKVDIGKRPVCGANDSDCMTQQSTWDKQATNNKKVAELELKANSGKSNAATAGWEAGGSQLMGGIGDLAMAGILDATGGQVFGKCSWPSGEHAAKEGDYISLNW